MQSSHVNDPNARRRRTTSLNISHTTAPLSPATYDYQSTHQQESGHGQNDENNIQNGLNPTSRSARATQQTRTRARGARGGGLAIQTPFSTSSASSFSQWEHMSVNPAHEASLSLYRRRRSSASTIPTPASTDSQTSRLEYLEHSLSPLSPANEDRPTHHLHHPYIMDATLPEDDGFRSLREQLHEIKQLAVSTEEKAKRMHFLMTENYLKHKSYMDEPPQRVSQPNNDGGLETLSLGAAAMPIDPKNPYNLRSGDLEPVFSTLPKNPKDEDAEDGDEDLPELGCMHYKRNVKVQCFDCQRWFPCRHCHDQAKDLPFTHSLNRKKTQNMLCMLCQTPQPAAEICVNCGEYAAWYFCPKCKLWDNDSNKRIYHCDDCGICRVGEGLGKDYVHCKRCNVCISISTSAAHPCIERATEGDCPLCLIPLFESRTPVVSLPCGHYMHGDCYKDLMAVTYKCPVCSKSAVNMELQWKKLDDEIALQPMPDEDEDLDQLLPHLDEEREEAEAHENEASTEHADEASTEPRPRRPRQVWVGCNDCGAHSWTPFHWLGLKCQRCDSYNTNQMAPTAVHETEAERLMRQQQVHRHDFTGDAVLRDAGIGFEDAESPPEAFNGSPSALDALEVPRPDVPRSPSLLSSSPRSSGAQSPGRYFVHDEEPRRPSFTAPRFSAPSMPTWPDLPDLPRLPRLPNLRENLPAVEFPRFSPYQMFDAVSRSLSPMRAYLQQGLAEDSTAAELNEHLMRRTGRRRVPSVARSDPARSPTSPTFFPQQGSKLRTESGGSEVEAPDLWAEESLEGSERVGEESSEDEEEDDGEEGEGGDEEGDGEEEVEELEIFGHR